MLLYPRACIAQKQARHVHYAHFIETLLGTKAHMMSPCLKGHYLRQAEARAACLQISNSLLQYRAPPRTTSPARVSVQLEQLSTHQLPERLIAGSARSRQVARELERAADGRIVGQLRHIVLRAPGQDGGRQPAAHRNRPSDASVVAISSCRSDVSNPSPTLLHSQAF